MGLAVVTYVTFGFLNGFLVDNLLTVADQTALAPPPGWSSADSVRLRSLLDLRP